jgi:uncharacterized protein YjdB
MSVILMNFRFLREVIGMRWTGRAAVGFAIALSVACGHKPSSIDVSPKRVKIYGLERSQRLASRVLDRKGRPLEDASPAWSSSNAEIVQAQPGGLLVAKKAGKATVTASYEGASAQVPVEVFDVSSLEIAPASVSLIGPAGTSVPLTCTVRDSKQHPTDLKPAWTSSDPKVATVSENGIVTSVGPGTATIMTKVGDVQAISEVDVRVLPITRLELHPATALVRVGDSQHYQVTAYGPDGVPIPGVAAAYRSSNPAVATIDSAGVAAGRSAGAATIRAELAGAFAEATLLVN